MDDEERLLSCQQEIRRLRNAIWCMEADERQYETELMQEIKKATKDRAGLVKALEIWQRIIAD